MINVFKKFVPMADKIVPRRTSLEILRNVCVRDGYITATDLDLTIRMKTDDSREYLLPIGIVKTVLKAKPRSIEVITDIAGKTRIDYDNKSVSFPEVEMNDYPAMDYGETKPLGIWTKDAINCLYQQVPYCSDDDLRPALQGVYVNQNGKFSSCATDGHVLRYVANVENHNNKLVKFEGIVPKRVLMLLPRMVKESVSVSMSDECYHFIVDDEIELISRKVEATYPNFMRLFPEDYIGMISLDKNRFLRLAYAAKDFAVKKTMCSILDIKNKEITMSVENVDVGTEWQSAMPVEMKKNKPMRIGFNITKLEKVLGSIDSDVATWKYNDANSAMIVIDDDHDDVTSLIMPIRIAEEVSDG